MVNSSNSPFYRVVIKAILRFFVSLLFRVETKNMHKVTQAMQSSQKTIFVCNHPSFMDGIMLGLFLPCDPVFLVHTTIFERPVFKVLLSLVDCLAIEPASPMALKTLANAVNNGRPVVVFPEGRITVTGGLMKIYEGSAFVAARTGATIIPITLQGLLKSKVSRMGHGYPRSWIPRTTIVAHDSRTIKTDEVLSAKMRRKQAGEQLRKIMQDTMFNSLNTHESVYGAFVNAQNYYGANHVIAEDLDRNKMSYRDMNQKAQGIGYILAKVTEVGQYVGVLLPNTEICAATFLGLGINGRVPAMLNYTMGVGAFQGCIKAGQIKTIVTARAFIEKGKLGHLVDAASSIGVNVQYLEDFKDQVSIADKAIIKKRAVFNWFEKVESSSPCVVLFTSGSEGAPKGVVLSHKAILSNIAQIRSVIDISIDDKVCNVLPMFHSFGLTAGTLLPMIAGAQLALYLSPLHYKVVPEFVYDRNCTILFGTNTFLYHYGRNAHNYDFFKLRYVIAGAEKVNDQTRMMWFERFGLRILEGYGATECAPVISVNTPMANRFGTVGQFLPGIEYQLEAIPGIDEGGLLHIKGPNVMSGYLKDEQPGVLIPAQSWYNTGDIVQVSPDGFVSIKGRVKRFAKIGGEMVSLEAVDSIVATCTTKLFATTSKPDASKGEQIVLFTTDDALTKEQIRNAVLTKNASTLAIPSDIRFVKDIPLLGSGKVDYQTLKTMI